MNSFLKMSKINELNKLISRSLNSKDILSTGEIFRLLILSAKATGFVRNNDVKNYEKIEIEIDSEIDRLINQQINEINLKPKKIINQIK